MPPRKPGRTMTRSRNLILAATLLALGGLFGWWLRPKLDADPPFPLAGGSVDCGFAAEVTWHPETRIEGDNVVMHQTTWKWTFRNRTEAPFEFSIPRQVIHLDRSIYSRQYVELPDSLLVEPPIVIPPGESLVLVADSGGPSWHERSDAEFGFRVVTRIDGRLQILGAAATVSKGPKADPVAAR